MEMYRGVWGCIGVYGDVYWCMGMYRSIWCCIGVHGVV